MSGTEAPPRLPPLGAALRHPEIRRVVVAFGLAVTAEWAFWIGLLVYAYERGGSTAAGFVSIGLLLPALVAVTAAGAFADGPRPNRVLVVVFVAEGLSLGASAVTAWMSSPVAVVVGLATVAAVALAFVRPTCAVVVPGLVSNPAELTAANVLTGWWESAAVLGGPALAAGLSALGGPSLVLAGCAGLSLVAAGLALPLRRLDGPAPVARPRAPARRSHRRDGVLSKAGAARMRGEAGAAGGPVAGVPPVAGVEPGAAGQTGAAVEPGAGWQTGAAGQTRATSTPAEPDVEEARRPWAAAVAHLWHGVRLLGRKRGARQVLVLLCLRSMLVGAFDLLGVVLAEEVFGLGDAGPGLLGAAIGGGALAGGFINVGLAGRPRLAPTLVAACAGMAIAIAALAATDRLPLALVILPVIGIGSSMVDLAARILLQRLAPQDALASVFAFAEVLSLAGCAVGAVLTQVLLTVSTSAALTGLVCVLVVALAVVAGPIRAVDAAADAPVVAVRVLRRLPLFAATPGPALEGVARSAEEIVVPSGTVLLREGDVGDAYYAVVSGTFDVSMAGQHVRHRGRGEGFGEIALLADVPRTATITAVTDGELLRIGRRPFLVAVTGHDASRRTAWAVARSYDDVRRLELKLDAGTPPTAEVVEPGSLGGLGDAGTSAPPHGSTFDACIIDSR